MFLVGGSKRPKKRKRSNRESPEKSGESRNIGKEQKRTRKEGQEEIGNPLFEPASLQALNYASFRKLEKAVAVSGVFAGVLEESSGKIPGKNAGKFFPTRQMLQILGFRAPGKANLPATLGPHCRDLVPTFPRGVFFEIDSSSLLEFF